MCLVLVICLSFLGCKNKSSDPFIAMNFNPYDGDLNKRIESYQNTTFRNSTNTKNEKPSIYIDFSSGINQAFKKSEIKEKLIGSYNALFIDKPDVYRLGTRKVIPIKDVTPTALGQMIDDQDNYRDTFAPLQDAVDSIVEKNNDALLITDFEEWQNKTEITSTAFLAPAFSKWLTQGNSIHFYIADYPENKTFKHIYFTVFSYGNENGNSMLAKLNGVLSPLTTQYHLSNKQYSLSQHYSTATSGGIFYGESENISDNKKFLDLKEYYVNGMQKGNAYEFYPFGVDWKTIGNLKNTYKEKFKNFFRKLFIDLSDESAYTYGDFDVKVYDVSNDFIYFSKCKEVEKRKPKLERGKSNGENKFADDEKDLIALSCYNTSGIVLDEWKYKPKEMSSVPEVFVLNKDLFNNTKNIDKKNTELAVAFHPNFSPANISNPDGLIRVDIILTTATPNLKYTVLNELKWINSGGVENKGLYNSVMATLQEPSVKPNNKTIYSYYIKTLQ